MELSINAFFAQEPHPLRKFLERRQLPDGRHADGTFAPSVKFPATARRAGTVTKRNKGERNAAGHQPLPRRALATDPDREKPRRDVTIAVLALDAYNARVYHDMLEVRGYFPVTAPDIDSWLRVIGVCVPDLILLDLCSADHPSIDVARAIMADSRYGAVPVITITNTYNSGDMSDPTTMIADSDGRIVKPISVDGFYRPIETILKRCTVRRSTR